MNAFVTLQNLLNSHFYLLVLLGAGIISIPAKKKEHYLLRLAGSVAACMLLCWGLDHGLEILTNAVQSGLFDCVSDMLRCLILYGMSVAAIMCCYQYTLVNACYVCVFGYTIQHMALLLCFMLNYYLTAPNGSGVWLFYAVYGIFYVGIYLIFRHRHLDEVSINNESMILQSVLFLFCSVILSVLSYRYVVTNEALEGTPAVFVVTMFGILICVNIVIGLLDSFRSRKVQDELSLTRRLWQQDVRQYERSKQTIDILNFRYHDLKNQMSLLLRDHTVYQEITDSLAAYYDDVRTGNEALDVVLTEKSILCRQKQIVLTRIADGTCLRQLGPVDLYSVLGNMIDNAVEYLSGIEDTEKRIITVMIRRTGDMDMIRVENYLDQQPQSVQGIPITTKQDKDSHGFGLKSIQYIIKKYGGIMRISTEDHLFAVTVAVPRADAMQQAGEP